MFPLETMATETQHPQGILGTPLQIILGEKKKITYADVCDGINCHVFFSCLICGMCRIYLSPFSLFCQISSFFPWVLIFEFFKNNVTNRNSFEFIVIL
jgi:hypothetical protein